MKTAGSITLPDFKTYLMEVIIKISGFDSITDTKTSETEYKSQTLVHTFTTK